MFVIVVELLLWAVSFTLSTFRVRVDLGNFHASTILLAIRFLTPVAWFIALTSLLSVQAKWAASG
jgi:hypothetical protein